VKTFADAAAREAYYVRPEDVRTEFKQTDNSTVYVATRQGAGAQAWEISYTVGDSDGSGDSHTDPIAGETLVASQNNYMPPDGDTRPLWLLTPTGADRNITGIDLAAAFSAVDGSGRVLTIVNGSPTQSLVLVANSGSSLAFNQFAMPHDVTLLPRESVFVFYDVSATRWHVLSVDGELQSAYDRGTEVALSGLGIEVTYNNEPIWVVDVGADEATSASPAGDAGDAGVAGVSDATAGGEADVYTVRTGVGGPGGVGAADGGGTTKHGADGGASADLYLLSGNGGDGGIGGAATGIESVSGDGGEGGSSGDLYIDAGSPGSGGGAGAASGGASAGSAGTGGATGTINIATSNASEVLSGRAEGIAWTHTGPMTVTGATSFFLPPRLTTAERNAISPTDGAVIYNTTTSKLQVRTGGAWVDLH
jgi:hypothetical protein